MTIKSMLMLIYLKLHHIAFITGCVVLLAYSKEFAKEAYEADQVFKAETAKAYENGRRSVIRDWVTKGMIDDQGSKFVCIPASYD